MPSVAAGAGGVPLFTPPQTPGHHVNGSTNSVPGMVPAVVKRESNASADSAGANVAAGVKRESNASESLENGEGRAEKRRRIAPTLISDGEAVVNPPAPPTSEPTPTSDAGGG